MANNCDEQILYKNSPLTGVTPCGKVFGINGTNGNLFYKNAGGTWSPITVSSSTTGLTDTTIMFSVNTDPNTIGTTFSPNTPALGTVLYISTVDYRVWVYTAGAYHTYMPSVGGNVNVGAVNQLTYYAANGNTVSPLTSITANRALISNGSGLPIASLVTNTELGYVSGVTSSIQAQFSGKWSKAGDSGTAGSAIIGTTDTQPYNFVADNIIAATVSNTAIFTFIKDTIHNSVYVGKGSGTGLNNIRIGGSSTLGSNTTGRQTVAIGFQALQSVSTAQDNVAIGYQTLFSSIGGRNLAIGSLAMFNAVSSDNCTAIGTQALNSITTGTFCAALGNYAGFGNTTGLFNTYIGSNSIGIVNGITTGSYNVLIGSNIAGITSSTHNNIILADGQGVVRFQINENGAIAINGIYGTAGQVLQTNGPVSAPTWVSASLGSVNFADEEVPSGSQDSINTTFTLANIPIIGSVKLYLRGLRLKSGVDYTISGLTITMILIPDSGDSFIADYRY